MQKIIIKGVFIKSFCFPLFKQRGINYPPASFWLAVHPFFQERSSLIGLSIFVHKLAVELKGKLQDDIPVSALYVKNAIVLQMESMQHVSRSGEKGGPSDLSDGG